MDDNGRLALADALLTAVAIVCAALARVAIARKQALPIWLYLAVTGVALTCSSASEAPESR